MNKPNKLQHETSPYLLQHANNPVNWYPWGKNAFQKSMDEDKPIFLSIGYSTCHWCHVMEHESFEDDEVALALNKDFIAIKVDKEERPDIDSIYMSVCQAMTGSGGWPLTILMTPNQKPFYAGTYLPKHSRHNMIGLIELLSEVKQKWQQEKNNIENFADEITDFIKNPQPIQSSQTSAENISKHAYESLSSRFDEDFGGFGQAPKFPMAHNLLFLMQYFKSTNEKRALNMAEKTLLQMYKGGLFDHVGFGFSRYSTDDRWLVPHFEKMLYDNALLILAYSKAYEITRERIYQDITAKTIKYILREMTNSQGGFYCAQDADSEGVEGKYYIFTPNEILKILGQTDGNNFNKLYNITDKGNFEGKNIPNLISTGILKHSFENYEKIYEYRKNRYKLHLDDKVLTAWNGLMIAALARAYAVFKNNAYLEAAQRASSFIKENLTENNLVFTSYREGKHSGTGFIDDYAFYIFGLLELYKVTLNKDYVNYAGMLTQKSIEEFYDEENDGFFLYGKTGEQLLTRPKETYDGAIPSGNSVMAYNLLVLSKLNKTAELEHYYNSQLKFMINHSTAYPSNHSFFMSVLLLHLNPDKEIVCVLKNESDLDLIVKQMPLDALVKVLECENNEYPLKNGITTFYVCEHNHCLPPTNEL